jgi:hypothetical protein
MSAPHGWSTAVVSVVACVVGLTAPSVATAAIAQLDANPSAPRLTVTASGGETNRVLVVATPGGYRVIDLGAALTSGSGCVAVSASEVFCGLTVSLSRVNPRIEVLAGDLDDFVSVSAVGSRVAIEGGDGEDELEVLGDCSFADEDFCPSALRGGPGDDTLTAAATSADLDGGPGADTFRAGRNTFARVDYSTRVNPIAVDPDGVADDGEAGEGDNVSPAVAFVLGGSGNDQITGIAAFGRGGNDTLTAGPNRSFFDGGPGDDVLIGGPRRDFLRGGPGDDELAGAGGGDSLSGNPGMDTIRGDSGSDLLQGGREDDLLVGGPGRDVMDGDAGDDTLRARDGFRDFLVGDRGRDRARVDRALDRIRSIEVLL